MAKRGLYANIHAKKKENRCWSGEKMRKPGAKGAPTAANFKEQLRQRRNLKRKIMAAQLGQEKQVSHLPGQAKGRASYKKGT